MSSENLISRGIFIYKNGFKKATKRTRKSASTFDNPYSDQLWYSTYKTLWNSLDQKIQNENKEMFSKVLSKLVHYIEHCYLDPVTEIPTAALLTGINMPDHLLQFRALSYEIQRNVSPHVAILNSEDCQSIKYLVESLIFQLIDGNSLEIDSDDETGTKTVKKSECSFAFLLSWYQDLQHAPKAKLVVIFPDFEGFPTKVLQDFISIVSGYINILPFAFVFGVATSLAAVHRALPYHVSSKVKIQVFNSSPSTTYLNNVLENILFTADCPFQLGGKVFNLFTDIFLFYDLSVSGFIQNVKYAMLEHFTQGNIMALCRTGPIKKIMAELSPADCENARRMLSFRQLVENEPKPELRIKLLTDNDYFKAVLYNKVVMLRDFIDNLHVFVRCLHALVHDLPRAPLGKQVREVYSFVVNKSVFHSQEYREAFQLLAFLSKDELVFKVRRIIGILNNNIPEGEKDTDYALIVGKLEKYLMDILELDGNAGLDDSQDEGNKFDFTGNMGRIQLIKQLSAMSMEAKPMNRYEIGRTKILKYISNILELYLLEPSSFSFNEIFFFNDLSIQSRIIGAHRAAIHTALNDPHCYLQCACCEIAESSVILPTMPDICIAYKLHLECGKMINLYDWLQAFLSIIDSQDEVEDSKRKVDPHLQARFTQAVAELEFLGFIKSSKRKTDHVARLTWGG